TSSKRSSRRPAHGRATRSSWGRSCSSGSDCPLRRRLRPTASRPWRRRRGREKAVRRGAACCPRQRASRTPRGSRVRRGSAPRGELEKVLESIERRERVSFFEIEPNPAASTDIRARVAAGEPLDGLVPDAVARLVAERGLYRP